MFTAWWLGFLGFAAWVSVHGVVVGRVWVFGGGAVGLGLEVVEPCRIWVFFFLFNSLVLKLWNLILFDCLEIDFVVVFVGFVVVDS